MKTPVLESLFIKIAGLRPTKLLKGDSGTDVSCGICEILNNIFLFCRAPPLHLVSSIC